MTDNILWDFIEELEGNSQVGYIPDPEGSNSGVTIASGFDLGCRSLADLQELNLIGTSAGDKVCKYLGLIGEDALDMLEGWPLKLTKVECDYINKQARKHAIRGLEWQWEAHTGIEFRHIDEEPATVICSLHFQYGHLPSMTPNFWEQVTTDDWEGALDNLRGFGDRYPTRRNKEADLLEGWLKRI